MEGRRISGLQVSKPKVATHKPLNGIAMWPSSSTGATEKHTRILERTASYREKTLMHERRPQKEQGKRSEVKHYFSSLSQQSRIRRESRCVYVCYRFCSLSPSVCACVLDCLNVPSCRANLSARSRCPTLSKQLDNSESLRRRNY